MKGSKHSQGSINTCRVYRACNLLSAREWSGLIDYRLNQVSTHHSGLYNTI